MSRRPKPHKRLALDSRDNPPSSAKPPTQLPVGISFKHADTGGKFCLSGCSQDEVRGVVNCLRKMTTMTRLELTTSGGYPKTGLAYTLYPDDALKVKRPAGVDPGHRIAGVRASERFRVFGFLSEQIFYVLWFDREHAIVPSG